MKVYPSKSYYTWWYVAIFPLLLAGAIYFEDFTFLKAFLIILISALLSHLLWYVRYIDLCEAEIRIQYTYRQVAIPYENIRHATAAPFFSSRKEIMLHIKEAKGLRSWSIVPDKMYIVPSGLFAKKDIRAVIEYLNSKAKKTGNKN